MVKVYKNVCITGAGNGIGRAVAIAMSNEGYNVVCADIDFKQAKDTLDFILNKQGSGIAVETDVTKAFDIKNMINSTVDEFGSLDILVNNAGVTRTSNIMDLTEKDWCWINDVNAKGTFFSLQAAAKQMIKQNQGGRIINMASVGGKGFVDVSNAIYAASKGAVISLTKTAAQELAKYEITVNAKGTFFSLQAAANQMIKQNQGGRIINMASVGGKGFVDVSNAIYAASKGAVISLTKTAAQELAKYEITVNSICPGITHTNILSGIVKKRALEQNKSEEEIMKHYARDIPLKRPNDPEDIAEMVVFLSSKGARNISGQSYNIDGGLIPS